MKVSKAIDNAFDSGTSNLFLIGSNGVLDSELLIRPSNTIVIYHTEINLDIPIGFLLDEARLTFIQALLCMRIWFD